MDPAWILLAKIVAAFGLLALILYGCSRAVRWAKKGGVGGELVGTALMFFSFGGALNPAKEVAAEQRKLKRNEEGSGDPDPFSDAAESDPEGPRDR
jgi:hypothetical protein